MSVNRQTLGGAFIGAVVVALAGGVVTEWRQSGAYASEFKRIDEKNKDQDRDIGGLTAANIEMGKAIGKLELNMAVAVEILRRLDDREKRAAIEDQLRNRQPIPTHLTNVSRLPDETYEDEIKRRFQWGSQ